MEAIQEVMEPFVWKSYFATDIDKVDQQHAYLVELINKFTQLFACNQLGSQDVEQLFEELREYACYHFLEEEQLMEKSGIDSGFLSLHIAAHQDFLAKVLWLHELMLADNPAAVKHLLEFLSNWLVYHMLGMDQQMAKQLAAIEKGCTAEQALLSIETAADSATVALLNALNSLFDQVSQRNSELNSLNQTLELKVRQRTRELQKANQQLELLSMTDSLTNLPNRRYAMTHLAKLWDQAEQQNKALSCLMIDADNFKQINDSYGHDAGDRVLVALTQQLKQNLRSDDVVCRLGGDEFFVICENTDCAGAGHIARLLLDAVAELKVVVEGGVWLGSISIGVASKKGYMQDKNELIKEADQGVYLAKKAGRNCAKSISE